MTLKKNLFNFLDLYCQPSKSVLLGLSGGQDSLVLFDLLMKYQKERLFSFGIAHIDHGWRPESRAEAAQLSEMAKKKKLPFHLKILDPSELKGNLEAACREQRLDFFAELCQLHGYQAVMLGHHADDQAETVLKKVLEGSSLPYLSGLQVESEYQGLRIWRPLLKINKKEILEWIHQEQLNPIIDSTNTNPKYLRARFRTNIIPSLSKEFGKNLTDTLSRIGSEGYELKQYLNHQLKTQIESIKSGPLGSYMDLRDHLPKHALEIRYLIRRLCEKENCFFSHTLNDKACDKLLSNAANIKLQMGECTLMIDRGRLFLLKQFSVSNIDCWNVILRNPEPARNGLLSIWEGKLCTHLPEGIHYSIGPARMQDNYYEKGSLDDWWTDHKVPAFLRQMVPVIYEGNKIYHEFLTGKTVHKSRNKEFIQFVWCHNKALL